MRSCSVRGFATKSTARSLCRQAYIHERELLRRSSGFCLPVQPRSARLGPRSPHVAFHTGSATPLRCLATGAAAASLPLPETADRLPTASAAPALPMSADAADADANNNANAEDMRLLLRHLASSVVVCTAFEDTGSIEETALPVGLTMSSFTSLSLSSTPAVTFNIAVPSRTEAVIARTRHFMIHILAGNSSGARVADVFRSGNAHPRSTARKLQSCGCHVVWPHAPPRPSQGARQPLLRGPGVLFALRCRLLEEPLQGLVAVRDHVIVLGEVLEIIEGAAKAVDEKGLPYFSLSYADRHYRRLDVAEIHGSQ